MTILDDAKGIVDRIDTLQGDRTKALRRLKGDTPGHPFRGNQHSAGGGEGGGDKPSSSKPAAGSYEAKVEATVNRASNLKGRLDKVAGDKSKPPEVRKWAADVAPAFAESQIRGISVNDATRMIERIESRLSDQDV